LTRQRKVTGIRGRNQIHVDPKIQDAKNVMVEIRAGTGGDEAVFFLGIYLECTLNIENRGWRTSVVDMNEGTSGGFKEVILKLAVKMFTEP
jgi:protein subunit release factor A